MGRWRWVSLTQHHFNQQTDGWGVSGYSVPEINLSCWARREQIQPMKQLLNVQVRGGR